jgi:hypothetical protein
LKELRPSASSIRVLFAFGPTRAAIVLLGGDKRGSWTEWYERSVPRAEDLFEQYLAELREEGLTDDP